MITDQKGTGISVFLLLLNLLEVSCLTKNLLRYLDPNPRPSVVLSFVAKRDACNLFVSLFVSVLLGWVLPSALFSFPVMSRNKPFGLWSLG